MLVRISPWKKLCAGIGLIAAIAAKVGLKSCWIYRRHADQGFGATMHPGDMPHYDFRFTSMRNWRKLTSRNFTLKAARMSVI